VAYDQFSVRTFWIVSEASREFIGVEIGWLSDWINTDGGHSLRASIVRMPVQHPLVGRSEAMYVRHYRMIGS
jgi:hypothetical protein